VSGQHYILGYPQDIESKWTKRRVFGIKEGGCRKNPSVSSPMKIFHV